MKNILVLITIAGAMVLIFVVGYFIGCPFRIITGIPCPGCGMTRAFTSLFHFDLTRAFLYHPLFPLIIITAILFVMCVILYTYKTDKSVLSLDVQDMNMMMKDMFSHKLTIVYICLFMSAFVAVYVIRFPNIP